MTPQEIMSKEFTVLMSELKDKHVSLGMKASGQWIDSLEIVSKRDSVKVIGEKYTEQLVSGRKPGKFPPIDAIKKWITDKGIVNNIKGNISVSSLAFLIARKIAKKGTNYFQKGGTDLVSSVFTPNKMQDIIDKVGAELTLTFTKQIENEFKKIAV